MDRSPAIARREKLSLDLEEILDAHAAEVADAMGELVAPVLSPGEAPLDWTTSFKYFRRKMAWVRVNMVEAEGRYRGCLEQDSRLCTHRDALAASVTQNLLRIRQTCHGWLGGEGLDALGLTGRIAKVEGAEAVFRKAREVADCLRQPDLDLTTFEGPDLKAFFRSMASSLEPEIQELSRTLTAIEDERSQADEHFDHRKQMIEAFDQDYLTIGPFAKAVLRMAGLNEVAERIQPSRRQLERKGAGE